MNELNLINHLQSFFGTFYSSYDAIPTLTILLKAIVLSNIALLFFYIPRNMKRIRRTVFFSKSSDTIEIVDTAKRTATQLMPLTVLDVEWYLQEVRKKEPDSLNGISKIILCNRPSNFEPNVLGSYSPNSSDGKIIRIYTATYHPLRELFTVNMSDVGSIKLGFSKNQMKRMMLATLGHEIGHNVMYDKTGRLFGEDVEYFCDSFSARMGIVKEPDHEANFFHVDDDADVYIQKNPLEGIWPTENSPRHSVKDSNRNVKGFDTSVTSPVKKEKEKKSKTKIEPVAAKKSPNASQNVKKKNLQDKIIMD